MTYEFYKELGELIQKHKLTLMTGEPDNLVKSIKGLEGKMIFISNGEKVVSLRGGENALKKAHTTILIHKNKYTKDLNK